MEYKNNKLSHFRRSLRESSSYHTYTFLIEDGQRGQGFFFEKEVRTTSLKTALHKIWDVFYACTFKEYIEEFEEEEGGEEENPKYFSAEDLLDLIESEMDSGAGDNALEGFMIDDKVIKEPIHLYDLYDEGFSNVYSSRELRDLKRDVHLEKWGIKI